ncbi:hypothetical protein SARC_07882 [Sphaeroforma arctica JP610]|uniref:Lipoyl-binding domain-containing protein n=1 Tax=Sphaeroforma arctica JP610 TaxID=667725 RepID=A0A0L0FUW7_9EUKA|nr:hypothetical protein SARC_07882 [Sphaeroforma arctica JP610]KNC79733.1 hypothetical protein SARC_07882 [Sphaeroforma arctica JP610]|eukprot:XP_014153635.1 hypothetical protein SARC_07882 [Sphaeroforma arctica JP610]
MSTYTDDECAAVGLPAGRSGVIIKWNVEKGSNLYLGQEVCVYKYEVLNKETQNIETRQKKLKTGVAGIVARIVVKENEAIGSNQPAVMIKEECKHELVSMGICNECEADVTL